MRLALVTSSAVLLAVAAATAQAPAPAMPLDPVAGILNAFKTHEVVALGEGEHRSNGSHAFRLALIRDPRFASIVNDIVVEFGSARYQRIIDAFVAGDIVPHQLLRKVWQDTTSAQALWDCPIYEEFFVAVRQVNAGLPPDRRIRVLLGDPPIDWDTVETAADVRKWGKDRDRHPASVVQREVLAKGRRALILYGDGHLWREYPVDSEGSRSIVGWLQADKPSATVFAVSTHILGGVGSPGTELEFAL